MAFDINTQQPSDLVFVCYEETIAFDAKFSQKMINSLDSIPILFLKNAYSL